jgi:hypothetical protein
MQPLAFVLVLIVAICIGNLITLLFIKLLGIELFRSTVTIIGGNNSKCVLPKGYFKEGNSYGFELGGTLKPSKPWSKNHSCCIECGRTDKPCHGHGLCSRCYMKKYKRPSRRSK